jgi:hypothetical protein
MAGASRAVRGETVAPLTPVYCLHENHLLKEFWRSEASKD